MAPYLRVRGHRSFRHINRRRLSRSGHSCRQHLIIPHSGCTVSEWRTSLAAPFAPPPAPAAGPPPRVTTAIPAAGMARAVECPRCGTRLRPPSAFSSQWRCSVHGAVSPLHLIRDSGPEALDHLVARCELPCWVPSPMPVHWHLAGLGYAGSDRDQGCASLVASSGPAPLGGIADMLLICEEPGIGLGAGYAGLSEPDPGPIPDLVRAATVEIGGHPTALWTVPGPDDRAVMVGEARGLWLWVILWPAVAGYLLAEDVGLVDLHETRPASASGGAHSPYLLRSAT